MDQITILNQLRNSFAKDITEHYSGKILELVVLNSLTDSDRDNFLATADESKRQAFFGSFVEGVEAQVSETPTNFMQKAISAIKPFSDLIAQEQFQKAIVAFESGELGETISEVAEGAKEYFDLDKIEENPENSAAFEDLRSYMKHVLSIESDEVVEQIVADVKEDIDEAKKKKEIIQTAVNEIKEAKDSADDELKEQVADVEEKPASGDTPPAETPEAPADGKDQPPAEGDKDAAPAEGETSTEGLSFEQAMDLWIPTSPRKFRDMDLSNETLQIMKKDFRRSGGGSLDAVNQRIADLSVMVSTEGDESTKMKLNGFAGKVREAVSTTNVEMSNLFRLGITNNSIIRTRSSESLHIAKQICKRFVLKKAAPTSSYAYSAENWNGMIEGAFDIVQFHIAEKKKPSSALRNEIYSRESAFHAEMKKLPETAKATLRTILGMESMLEIGAFGKPFVAATKEALLSDKKDFNPQDIYADLYDGASSKLETQFGRKLSDSEGTILQNALQGVNAVVAPNRFEQITLKIGENAISTEGLELTDTVKESIVSKARTFTTISYAIDRLGIGKEHQKTLMNLIR